MRLLGNDLFQGAEGLIHLVVSHQGIGVKGAIVEVVRVFLGQCLDGGKGLLVAVHLHVEGTFGQRDAFAFAIDELHAVQHVDGFLVVLLLVVETVEHFQQFLATLVLVVHLLNHGNGVGVFLLGDI